MGNGAFFCDGGLRIICSSHGVGSGRFEGALRGFAIAMYNARAARWVVPFEFVRHVCRAAAVSFAVQRMRAEFAGYLVSDPVEPFAAQRAAHDLSCEPELITGGCAASEGQRFSDVAGGNLDAPEFMPAGACDEVSFLFGSGMPSQSVKRGAGFAAQWFDALREEKPFSDRRGKHSNESGVDRLTVTGYGRGWMVEAREGFDCTLADLSAPEYMAAGAMECGVATRFGQRGWQQIAARP